MCSQNRLEPQPLGTFAIVAAQSCAETAEARKRSTARKAARRKESEEAFIFVLVFGLFLFCSREKAGACVEGDEDAEREKERRSEVRIFEGLLLLARSLDERPPFFSFLFFERLSTGKLEAAVRFCSSLKVRRSRLYGCS